jgi:type I restriction enzyme S subunit
MSSELREFVLGDICRFMAGSAFSPDEQGAQICQYPFIKVSDLNLPGNEVVIRTANNYVTEAQRLRMKAKLHPAGSTVFAKIGVALTSNRRRLLSVPTIIDNNMMSATAIQDFVRPRFLYYLLKTLDFNTIAAGTALPYLNVSDLQKIAVAIPCLESQSEIESVLAAVDDRITLLRETNATLEAIAQALFKSWFVDFDPVRAKMAGRAPEGMDEATAALFPDALDETELGLVPKGWAVQPLDEIANYLNGLALQKFPPTGVDDLPVIKIVQLRKGDTVGADKAARTIKPEYIIQNGDVLFSWSGSLEVDIWCGGEGALNQHLFKVTSQRYPKWFYYLWTKHHLEHFRQVAASKATTMGHIQRSHLSGAKAFVPLPDVLDSADQLLSPILDRLIAGALQASALSELRDTLLPRLISGQLRVPEAQNEVVKAIE